MAFSIYLTIVPDRFIQDHNLMLDLIALNLSSSQWAKKNEPDQPITLFYIPTRDGFVLVPGRIMFIAVVV